MRDTVPKTAMTTRPPGPLARIGSALLDLVMPLNCVGCGKEGSALCDVCALGLPRLREPSCAICARPGTAGTCYPCLASPPDVDGIRAPFLYDGHARQLVHRLKYNNARSYAGRLAELLAEFMAASAWEADVIVPVQLHPRRERARGYNHSELLVRDLGRNTSIAVMTSALVRTKDTPPQVSLRKAEQRRRNVRGAFECRRDMDGMNVLVVDDVVTTGATMSACAEALKEAGAGSVWGLAFARNPPPA